MEGKTKEKSEEKEWGGSCHFWMWLSLLVRRLNQRAFKEEKDVEVRECGSGFIYKGALSGERERERVNGKVIIRRESRQGG